MSDNKVITMTDQELRDIVRETVHTTLTSLGIQYSEPIEMQKDFQHLRDWRRASDEIRSKTWLTLVGLFVSGIVGAVLLGLKEYFKS